MVNLNSACLHGKPEIWGSIPSTGRKFPNEIVT